MNYLRSLFCWVGYDNRYRFALIIALSHLFFITFSTVFHQSLTLQLFTLMISAATITFTTKRRLMDGKLTSHWLYMPVVTFSLVALLILSIGHQAFYWLTLLSMGIASILLTYASKQQVNYIYGYAGPVNLTPTSKNSHNNTRIEPTIINQSTYLNTEYHESNRNIKRESKTNNHHSQTIDLGELFREKFLNKKNSKFILVILIFTIALTMIMTLIINNKDEKAFNESPSTKIIKPTLENDDVYKNRLILPDEFSLMTTSHEGLVIHWQADENQEKILWNIRQAIGDKSCKSIQFNNKSTYRTTFVKVEERIEYYAEFSPLDLKNLIGDIAKHNSFLLCGYSFSLAGSQASLNKNIYYAEKISQ